MTPTAELVKMLRNIHPLFAEGQAMKEAATRLERYEAAHQVNTLFACTRFKTGKGNCIENAIGDCITEWCAHCVSRKALQGD